MKLIEIRRNFYLLSINITKSCPFINERCQVIQTDDKNRALQFFSEKNTLAYYIYVSVTILMRKSNLFVGEKRTSLLHFCCPNYWSERNTLAYYTYVSVTTLIGQTNLFAKNMLAYYTSVIQIIDQRETHQLITFMYL